MFQKSFLFFTFLFLISGAARSQSIVTGTIKWEGPVPTLGAIDMTKDPACVAKHKDGPPPVSQALELGTGNTVANILVKVKSGLPSGKTYTPPTEPLIIAQNGCIYEPHVFGIMKGQPLKFLNQDGVLHNVHALSTINRQFNISMSKTMTESGSKVFNEEECAPFRIKCDIHPWMLSYACVIPHPFFSVTGKDGSFKIENLPAGTYEIEAWHEKAGTKVALVTVGASDTKTVDFTFSK